MYIKATLTDEISRLVNGKMDRGDVLSPDWITNELCKRHLGEHTKNESFTTYCIVSFVRDLVGKYCKKKKGDDEADDGQVLFSGELFDAPRYTDVRRENKIVFVLTDSMTELEFDTKGEVLLAEGAAKTKLGHVYKSMAAKAHSIEWGKADVID